MIYLTIIKIIYLLTDTGRSSQSQIARQTGWQTIGVKGHQET